MIRLSKSGRININRDEEGNNIDTIFFGTSWGNIRGFVYTSSTIIELNTLAILLDAKGNNANVVYFDNKITSGVQYLEKDLIEDDNEVIEIFLSQIERNIQHVFFVLKSCNNQRFDKIPYIKLRIYTDDQADNIKVLSEYILESNSTEFKNKMSVILGEIYRRNCEWKFKALGRFSETKNIDEIISECRTLI